MGLVVAIPKVVPVACWDKGKAKRVVGRRAAAVRVPNQVRRIAGIAAGCEGRKSDAVEILIGDLACRLPLDKRGIDVTRAGSARADEARQRTLARNFIVAT